MSTSNGDDDRLFPNFETISNGLPEGSYVESKRFLEDIVENIPVMVFVKEAEQLRFTYINRVGEQLLGMNRDALIGKNDYDFFPEEQADFFTQKDREVLAQGEVVDIPKEPIETGEGKRLLHTKKVPIQDEEGNPRFLLGISEDITERVRARQTLEEAEERNRQILAVAHEAFISIDEEGVIVDWNAQATETFGWDRDEVIGRSLADTIVPPRYRDEHNAGMEQFFETGEGRLLNERVEVPAIHKEGHEFPVELTVSPLEIDGTYTFNGFIHDISERKERERRLQESRRELEKAKIEAEEANEAKSQFLARMSHEIRTPMNGVTGMLELLSNTELSRRQEEYLELARESAEGLRDLINDLLDLSKIEVGEVELRDVPFDLRDTVADTLQTLAVRASDKGLELTFFIPRDVPDPLVGDPGRLRQILVNLANNSIKFTDQGEIVVWVETFEEEEVERGRVALHFRVRDTGPGIEPEEQEEIFEKFSRTENSIESSHGGTGLGLAISAHLVELMNGDIWVESEPGEGSVFHFTAEFGVREDDPNFPHRGPDVLEQMPVLIVDDNATNRRVLENMIENWGMSPTVVSGGREAIEEMEAAIERGEPYPLVLLDAVMPDVDGVDVAQFIDRQPAMQSTAVLMLSSAENRPYREHSREVHIDDILTKPVKQSALLDAITSVLDITAEEEIAVESNGETEQAPERCLRVLLAEDGRVNRRVAVRLLEQRGHDVVAVDNGEEAVQAVEEEVFDLVLMDVRMPKMDGFEATRTIRDFDGDTSNIPIVALTAHAMKGDREECLEVGMDEYVAKPVEPEELHAAIRNVVGPEAGSEPLPEPGSSFDCPLDWQTALQRVDGSPETLEELTEIFLEESPQRLEQLRSAAETEDAEGVCRAAHTLKGSLEFFVAERAVDVAIRVEELGERQDFTGVEDQMEELERQLDRVCSAMRQWLDGE